MNRTANIVFAVALVGTASCLGANAGRVGEPAPNAEHMEITPAGSRSPMKGPATNFVGSVMASH